MAFWQRALVPSDLKLNRRRFISLVVLSGFACFSPRQIFATTHASLFPEKSLSLYNPDTSEALDTVYWSNGEYVDKALVQINHILRDRHSGQTKPIDIDLLDLLHAIGMKLRVQDPFHVISGYRSPETNALLRRRGRPTAKNSFHVQGKAVDIRLPGYSLASLRRVSARLEGGGVGYYPSSQFVHVDVGPVRYWSGH